MLTAKEIRESFKEFFRSKEHQIVPSAPMVIKDDPTLMFTNAGMNQFKDIILGNAAAKYKRVAVSSGVRVLDRFDYEDEGILTLEVNSLLLKKVITVPKNPMDGFPWSFNSEQDYIIKSDLLPTIDFGFHYVLNFAVCGEFNLSLWYVPEGTEEPRHMLSTGFCCK